MAGRGPIPITAQPDDSTCGPACLHAVYSFHGERLSLETLIREVPELEGGGTLAVHLACHALAHGYGATIYTYNLDLFDPSWFVGVVDLAERLRMQARAKRSRRLRQATEAYLEYLERGGRVCYEDLDRDLLRRHLDRDRPILTGLSATHLYGCAREVGERDLQYDDVRGQPVGHFVVLYGYDDATDRVLIADPTGDNPRFTGHHYEVEVQRVLASILLGVLTYDANLLVLEPPARPAAGEGSA